MTEPATTAVPAGQVLVRAATALAELSGWRRYASAAVCGVAAVGALPPVHLVPLLWPAFAGLLWLLDGVQRPRGAFLTGWAFGTGFFLAGLYWVGIAFLVDAEQYAALIPLAVGGLAAGLGLFPAVAIFAVWTSRRRGLQRAALLAAMWLALEWVRSWVFTGFPWNLIGSVWVFSESMLQFAAVAGVWGLSLITVLAAAAASTLGEVAAGPLRRWLPCCAGLVLIAVIWLGGAWRLAVAPDPNNHVVPDVALRLVQPNIAQSNKWRADLRSQHIADQMAMSLRGNGNPVTHLVWSETASTFGFTDNPELRQVLAGIVPAEGLLLTGAPRRADQDGRLQVWNSFHALDSTGAIRGTYDKFHLVPFGEYMPFRSLLGLAKLTQGRLDFSPGPGLRTLVLPGLPPVSPLICYEVIFPGRVVASGPRPEWLLNLTNDAWFGTSSGPYQHFASARLRAVEEGIPIVRVANSGISAVVDGYGRVLRRLGLNRIGVIDSPLPRPVTSWTLFSRIGDWTALILVATTAAVSLAWRRRRPG